MVEAAMQENTDNEILSHVDAGIGWITLNRPRALNSLSLNMIRQLTVVLKDWANDPQIKAVVIHGEGERAFCAGGDVRAAYEAKKQDKMDLVEAFFREEYALNTLIHEYPKPYYSLLDGIAMGGGLGISMNSPYAIVTENSLMAMPETGIGFFPDVGATWFLSNTPDKIGLYLAMTGNRFNGADALYAGLSEAYIPSGRLPDLREALKRGTDPEMVLDQFKEDPPEGKLEAHALEIAEHFDQPSVMEIVSSLEASETAFAKEALDALRTKSPLSIHVAFRQLTSAPRGTFRDLMKREFRLSQHFAQGHDFFEGVRALLVDKDRSPQWEPARLEDVTQGQVLSYFESLGDKELTF